LQLKRYLDRLAGFRFPPQIAGILSQWERKSLVRDVEKSAAENVDSEPKFGIARSSRRAAGRAAMAVANNVLSCANKKE
jgi:hypothetical protein